MWPYAGDLHGVDVASSLEDQRRELIPENGRQAGVRGVLPLPLGVDGMLAAHLCKQGIRG